MFEDDKAKQYLEKIEQQTSVIVDYAIENLYHLSCIYLKKDETLKDKTEFKLNFLESMKKAYLAYILEKIKEIEEQGGDDGNKR